MADDGAPLIQINSKGKRILLGIATIPKIPGNTNKCPLSTQSSKFALISEFIAWIETTINLN